MRDGLNAARNELPVYLDGDLSGLRRDIVARLAGPLLDGTADFVRFPAEERERPPRRALRKG